jgi:hypothetical protein
MQDGHRHQAKTPSTRPRADRQRLTVLSGFNTIAKRAKSVSTRRLCVQPSSFIRVHKPYRRLPGLSAARRNTRGSHSVNQGLAPNSRKLISHASPEAVPFSTRAPSLLFVAAVVLRTFSLVLFLSLAVFILDRLHRLRWPSPLPRLRSLLPRAVLPRSPFRLPSFLVSDQRHGPPSHNGYPRRHFHFHIHIPLLLLANCTSPGRCLLTSGLLTRLFLPIR